MGAAIAQEAMDAIRAHGAAAYPHECCGILLGLESGDQRRITAALPLENRQEDLPERRYLIFPQDVLHAEKTARQQGLELLGYYHSHPDHPAEPSAFDRDHAWPWYSYIIVAVGQGQPEALRSWQLRDDRSGFDEEVLQPF